ncbi:hypothetical protein Halha_0968 [Halobacteroides halobius DSM 5150]|uniref:Uncharacterized protein n=1 Tax=Halobacteroides halobius (strain ATCC 35273 / DSM 5150 / MD-1) TaxID=748449 RepID=L0K999_HALHC|nr:hypothetical protein [Halobacteroides halobius]AGB40929.1 hypothetical protein Halha_0968 [Halobacteroides halobius DSM 5150]
MKYSKEVGKLVSKLNGTSDLDLLAEKEKVTPQEVSCQACSCQAREHDSYTYCPIIEGYLCRICCSYELCNDYQLVNKILKDDIFTSDQEVRLLCNKCENTKGNIEYSL